MSEEQFYRINRAMMWACLGYAIIGFIILAVVK